MEISARRLAGVLRALLVHPLPVVARIHGPVRAGGLGIVAACDLAIADDTVTYAFTEARLGLTPAVISLSVLPRMTARVARTTFLTAESFDSSIALESGLITHAVPSDRLDQTVDLLVAALATCERQGLAATKRLLNADALAYFDDRMEEMITLSTELFASDVARTHLSKFARCPTVRIDHFRDAASHSEAQTTDKDGQ